MKVESPQEPSIIEIDLALGGLHRHVAHAWFLAREHADPSAITAQHLLTAAAALAPLAPKSDPAQHLESQPAFAAWATLLGSLASEIHGTLVASIGAKSIERWDERIARGGSETFLVMEGVKRIVDAALPFIFKAARARGDQRPLMWGRDLVAIGLLAVGDPTARKVATAAGSTLERFCRIAGSIS